MTKKSKSTTKKQKRLIRRRRYIIAAVVVTIAGVLGVLRYNQLQQELRPRSIALADSSELSLVTRQELLTLINQERAKVGVKPLVEDARLDQSAQLKADDMNVNNYFAHANPTTGKQGVSYIFEVIGHGVCHLVSENIDLAIIPESDTAPTHVLSWMNSKPHREALLDPSYELTGFGIVANKVVEHFCDPA